MMTTAEMNMTASQEAQLETAILNVLHRWRLDDNYRLKRLEIEQEYKWRGKPGDIRVIMEIDNGLPGTFGYIFPIHAHFFIGRNGGMVAYRRGKKDKKKLVKETGHRALIHCTYDW